MGGGVSVLYRERYPAPLGVVLVMQLAFHVQEANSSHMLRVDVTDADGHPVFPAVEGRMVVGDPPPPGPLRQRPITSPSRVPLPADAMLPHPGVYQINILVDGRLMKSLPFAAVDQPPWWFLPPPPALPE